MKTGDWLMFGSLLISALWLPLVAVVGYRVRRRDRAADHDAAEDRAAAAAERAALAATLKEHSDALGVHTTALAVLVQTINPLGGTPLPIALHNLELQVARIAAGAGATTNVTVKAPDGNV